MKKELTMMLVTGLALIVDFVCFRQITGRESAGSLTFLSAALLIAAGAALFLMLVFFARRFFVRQIRPLY